LTRLIARMKKVALTLLAVVVLAGCGSSTEDVWGGYTEGQVKDLLSDPQFKQEILQTAPPSPRGPIHLLYPSDEMIDDTDLNKVTVQGEENWEYRDEENEFCIYVAEDPSTDSYIANIGPCIAD
jgi:hypothetical protein